MSVWMDFLGARIGYTELHGHNIRYAAAGEGEPVVLVHGTGGHFENYGRMFQFLKRDFTVYAFDLPGYGFSDKPETDYTIPFWGEHLEAFLSEVVRRPAFVVGQSLGGWIAAYVALKNPSLVKKLVLLTSVGLRLMSGEETGLANFQRFNRASAGQEPSKDAIRERYRLNVKHKEAIPEEWVDVRCHVYTQPDTRRVMYRWTDYVTGIISESEEVESYLLNEHNAKRLTMPVLFLWAEFDSLTPLSAVHRIVPHCPQGELYVVKDAGHWPHVEKPEEVNPVVKTFFLS